MSLLSAEMALESPLCSTASPVPSGWIPARSASIRWMCTRLPEHKRAGLLGRVFQDPMQGTAAKMSVSENLALAARRGKHRGLRWGLPEGENQEFTKALEMLGLGLERRLDDKIGLLSGGQRQATDTAHGDAAASRSSCCWMSIPPRWTPKPLPRCWTPRISVVSQRPAHHTDDHP